MSLENNDFHRRESQPNKYNLFRDAVLILANQNITRNENKASEKNKLTDLKALCERIKYRASDFCSIFAGIGLFLMVLENELIIQNLYQKVNKLLPYNSIKIV